MMAKNLNIKMDIIKDKILKYIEDLSIAKRYNLRTNKHLKTNRDFNKNLHNKYMSHQPYEDLKGMEIEKVSNGNQEVYLFGIGFIFILLIIF